MAWIRINFWGVRGSVPVPGLETARIGGNTSCVQVTCGAPGVAGETELVFDGGTGLRRLGRALTTKSKPNTTFHMFFSHVHWDHIQGFPFFAPAFNPRNTIHMYGGAHVAGRVETALRGQMETPSFPLQLSELPAEMTFHDLADGARVELEKNGGPEGIVVRAASGVHPGGVLAYRVEFGGRSMVYMTDHEPDGSQPAGIIELSRGADVLIYDCMYTPEEYAGEVDGMSRVGWGHSTFVAGVDLAREAGAKQLILFHHDPDQDDAAVDDKERRARELFPNARSAVEGLKLELNSED